MHAGHACLAYAVQVGSPTNSVVLLSRPCSVTLAQLLLAHALLVPPLGAGGLEATRRQVLAVGRGCAGAARPWGCVHGKRDGVGGPWQHDADAWGGRMGLQDIGSAWLRAHPW